MHSGRRGIGTEGCGRAAYYISAQRGSRSRSRLSKSVAHLALDASSAQAITFPQASMAALSLRTHPCHTVLVSGQGGRWGSSAVHLNSRERGSGRSLSQRAPRTRGSVTHCSLPHSPRMDVKQTARWCPGARLASDLWRALAIKCVCCSRCLCARRA